MTQIAQNEFHEEAEGLLYISGITVSEHYKYSRTKSKTLNTFFLKSVFCIFFNFVYTIEKKNLIN